MSAALARCRRGLFFAGFFSLLVNLLALTVSLYMMQVYDRVLTSRSLDTLLYLTAVALLALATLGFLELARSRLLLNVSVWLEQTLAPRALERAMDNALRGRVYRAEALRDARELRTFVGGAAVLALFDAPWVPLFLMAIFLLHPWLGATASAAAILLFGLAILNDRATRRPVRAATEAGMLALRQAEAGQRNAEAVDALGMQRALVRRWARHNMLGLRLQALAGHRASVVLALSKATRLAVQILMLAAGAYLVIQQELTGGAMIAGSIILGRALAPIEQMIGAWRQVVGAHAAYRRLSASLGELPRRPRAMVLPAPRGALAAEGLGFALSTGRPLLRNVTFALAPGEILAVIGPSAAGKSTLARVLVGTLPPSAGHVRLDGADIFPQSRDTLGPHLGYLPQDIELFAGSVAENIARLGEADPDAVVDAAQMADCHDMILRLPCGYDTEIGESGAHLSGGQRQRIALARALYGRPRLVVLDEPNAYLDSEGEAALARALAWLKKDGATVVLVTHRSALVRLADKILVLRDGVPEMFGPRHDILQRLQSARPVVPLRAPSSPGPTLIAAE